MVTVKGLLQAEGGKMSNGLILYVNFGDEFLFHIYFKLGWNNDEKTSFFFVVPSTSVK